MSCTGFTALYTPRGAPGLQIRFFPGALDSDMLTHFNLPQYFMTATGGSPLLRQLQPMPSVTFFVCLTLPRSAGTVNITSLDPTAAPYIDLGCLHDGADVQRLVEGIRVLREQVLDSECWEVGSLRADEICDEQVLQRHPDAESDGYLTEYVRRYTVPLHQAHGSCALGKVVDPALRVHGALGLRIADASVIPSLSVAPEATVMMVAEKCASLITSELNRGNQARL